MIFGTFNLKTTFLLKSGPIFDEAGKPGKATWATYNLEGWPANCVSSFGMTKK